MRKFEAPLVVPPSGGTAVRAGTIGAPLGGARRRPIRRVRRLFARIPPEGGATSPKGGPTNRRGVSLIEMIVVISISSVIIGVCSTTMHLLLRSEREQSREVRTTVAISRLSQVFREDVHAAQKCQVVAEGKPHMELTAPGGRRILY